MYNCPPLKTIESYNQFFIKGDYKSNQLVKLNDVYNKEKLGITVCSFNLKESSNHYPSGSYAWRYRYYNIKESKFFNIPYDNYNGAIITQYKTEISNNYPEFVQKRYSNILDLICFQEVTYIMWDDWYEVSAVNEFHISKFFDTTYYGLYNPTPSSTCGNAIVYNKIKFEVADKGVIYLRTSAKDSTGVPGYLIEGTNWAGIKRTCTWMKLIEKSTGVKFLILNLHLPTYTEGTNNGLKKGDAQRWSLNTLRKAIDETLLADESDTVPIILAGDFNCNPDTFSESGYRIIQSIIGPKANEFNNETIGTDYYFVSATQTGKHNIKYYKDCSINGGVDYTMAANGDDDWDTRYALKDYSVNTKALFDYIFISRWPTGDNIYNTSRRLYLTHDPEKSFVASSGLDYIDTETLLSVYNDNLFSDHCPVISYIEINNPYINDKEIINLDISIDYNTTIGENIKITVKSDKVINDTINLNFDINVGKTIIHKNIELVFNNTDIVTYEIDESYSDFYDSSYGYINFDYDSQTYKNATIINTYNYYAFSNIYNCKINEVTELNPVTGILTDIIKFTLHNYYNNTTATVQSNIKNNILTQNYGFDISYDDIPFSTRYSSWGWLPYATSTSTTVVSIPQYGKNPIDITLSGTTQIIKCTSDNNQFISNNDYVSVNLKFPIDKIFRFGNRLFSNFIDSTYIELIKPEKIVILGTTENIVDHVDMNCEAVTESDGIFLSITYNIPKSTGMTSRSSLYISDINPYIRFSVNA